MLSEVVPRSSLAQMMRLNPCSIGICSLSIVLDIESTKHAGVLILVLLEYAL